MDSFKIILGDIIKMGAPNVNFCKIGGHILWNFDIYREGKFFGGKELGLKIGTKALAGRGQDFPTGIALEEKKKQKCEK